MYLVDASLKCNFEERPEGPCVYCYNTPPRRALGEKEVVDLDAIEKTLRQEYAKWPKTIVLHGGEPLYLPKKVLERLLKVSFELSGKSSLQTNGSLVDDEKIALFKKYNTFVGVSIDGYWPANRWRGRTKKWTDLVIENIFKLKKAGIPTGLIITLHKDNANPRKIKYIEDFIFDMAKERIFSKVNLIIHPNPKIELSPREAKWAYLRLAKFVLKHDLSYIEPFHNIVENLLGHPLKDCIFTNCDPYCTGSASIITSDGTLTMCKKFQTEVFLRDSQPIYTRWEILQQTDCKDCPYGGKICFGGCPAQARDWDWRNKTRFCLAYKALYQFLEKKLKTLAPNLPLRTDPNFRGCYQGPSGFPHNDTIQENHTEHGDSYGPWERNQSEGHGDVPHGDHTEHGDSSGHGDHTEHGDSLGLSPLHQDAFHGDHSEHGDAP